MARLGSEEPNHGHEPALDRGVPESWLGTHARSKDKPMNGTVIFVSRQAGSGAIRSSAGEHFDFDLTGVVAYDVAALAEGQAVHFDLVGGASPRAVHISIDPICDIPTAKDRNREIGSLRYMGFEHRGSVRCYCFEKVTSRRQTQAFSVAADLRLFQTYGIRIQEGPALCLRVLSVRLESEPDQESLIQCSLTPQDMTAFVASQLRRPRPGPRRTWSSGQAYRC